MAQKRAESADRLRGKSVLIVEDELFVGMELESTMEDAGAERVRLCRTVGEALSRVVQEPFSVAVLDIRLGNEFVSPVAYELAGRGTPFLFYTGQSNTEPILAQWPDCTIVHKPAQGRTILKAVAALVQS